MFRIAMLGVCLAAATTLSAQTFSEPVRVQAGNGNASEDRLFPSPAFHDITGDGKLEMVVGDLRGNLTFAVRNKDGWGEEKPLLATDGQPLKFRNW